MNGKELVGLLFKEPQMKMTEQLCNELKTASDNISVIADSVGAGNIEFRAPIETDLIVETLRLIQILEKISEEKYYNDKIIIQSAYQLRNSLTDYFKARFEAVDSLMKTGNRYIINASPFEAAFCSIVKKYNQSQAAPIVVVKKEEPKNKYDSVDRASPRYAAWRGAVLLRDDFTCIKCGDKQGPLHAHHIEPYAHEPGKACSPTNGITFCKICHKEFHGKYGNSPGKQELAEFLSFSAEASE